MRLLSTLPVVTLLLSATGCLEFSPGGRYACDQGANTDCDGADGGAVLAFTSANMADAYLGVRYEAAVVTNRPASFTLTGGGLPDGLALAADGRVTGTPQGGEALHGQAYTFTVKAEDDTRQQITRTFTLTLYAMPRLAVTTLPEATLDAPYLTDTGEPIKLEALYGKSPLSFSVSSGLPATMSVAQDGTISGVPAGAPGVHTLAVVVTDDNGRSASGQVSLPVTANKPIPGGGMSGGPLTDVLTVFVIHESGNPVVGAGVRLRRNNQEFDPPLQALTDASGRASFTNLGLNGTSDHVDVTVSGRGLINTSVLKVNSSVLSVRGITYPEPFPRSGAAAAFDPAAGRITLTGGTSSFTQPGLGFAGSVCNQNVVVLESDTSGAWREQSQPGVPGSPTARSGAEMVSAGGRLLLFGGAECEGAGRVILSDLWSYDGVTRKWTNLHPGEGCATCVAPPAREGFAMIPSATGLWIVGGHTAFGQALGDVWHFEFATATWSNKTPTTAFPISQAAGAPLPNGGFLLCGGRDGAKIFSSCFASSATGSWAAVVQLPKPVYGARLAYDKDRQQLYLFGGMGALAPQATLYRIDVANKSAAVAIAQGGPPGGVDVIIDYDPTRRQLIAANTLEGATWATDGQTWTRLSEGPFAGTRTITGAVRGGPGQFAFVTASSTSGWAGVTLAANQTGAFAFSGIPPGDEVLITALSQDSTTPYVFNSGVLPPSSVASLIDAVLEAPPATKSTAPAVEAPIVWGTSWSKSGYVMGYQKGFSPVVHLIGIDIGGTTNVTYADPGTDVTARLSIIGTASGNATGSPCEQSVRNADPDTMRVVLERGIGTMTPGASACSTGEPIVAPAAYSFTLPPTHPGADFAIVTLGVAHAHPDWLVYLPTTAGVNSFTLPHRSTEVPVRGRVAGQRVEWNVSVFGRDPDAPVPFSWSEAQFAHPFRPYISRSVQWRYVHADK